MTASGEITGAKDASAYSGKKFFKFSLLLIVLALHAAGTLARNAVWHSGMRLWQDVLTKSPNKARPHNNLGILLLQENFYEDAAEQFNEALRLNPEYAEAYGGLATALLALDKPNEAVQILTIGLAKYQQDHRLHMALGFALLRQGALSEAEDEFRYALYLRPGYEKAIMGLSFVREKMGLKPDR
jgi:Flp pilus assembly protein TadD